MASFDVVIFREDEAVQGAEPISPETSRESNAATNQEQDEDWPRTEPMIVKAMVSQKFNLGCALWNKVISTVERGILGDLHYFNLSYNLAIKNTIKSASFLKWSTSHEVNPLNWCFQNLKF